MNWQYWASAAVLAWCVAWAFRKLNLIEDKIDRLADMSEVETNMRRKRMERFEERVSKLEKSA